MAFIGASTGAGAQAQPSGVARRSRAVQMCANADPPRPRAVVAGWAVAAALLVHGAGSHAALAAAEPVSRGAQIFESNCAACHLGGGNILPFARSKTLKKPALEKAKLYEKDAMVEFVSAGKGAMPSYKDKLERADLDEVAEFILTRAAENWK
ncbi:Cytochrome c6 [Porphyridium purpureum]|uniref:Cytochrome c-553 n=1 Tax=Porphyridium purpureum TaxID=35688 RepID=A0A5J4Z4J1_PORPP|nr:Cytochrome c6 [Porphyridium purpureum]|eukprot:POR2395..scf295_1